MRPPLPSAAVGADAPLGPNFPEGLTTVPNGRDSDKEAAPLPRSSSASSSSSADGIVLTPASTPTWTPSASFDHTQPPWPERGQAETSASGGGDSDNTNEIHPRRTRYTWEVCGDSQTVYFLRRVHLAVAARTAARELAQRPPRDAGLVPGTNDNDYGDDDLRAQTAAAAGEYAQLRRLLDGAADQEEARGRRAAVAEFEAAVDERARSFWAAVTMRQMLAIFVCDVALVFVLWLAAYASGLTWPAGLPRTPAMVFGVIAYFVAVSLLKQLVVRRLAAASLGADAAAAHRDLVRRIARFEEQVEGDRDVVRGVFLDVVREVRRVHGVDGGGGGGLADQETLEAEREERRRWARRPVRWVKARSREAAWWMEDWCRPGCRWFRCFADRPVLPLNTPVSAEGSRGGNEAGPDPNGGERR